MATVNDPRNLVVIKIQDAEGYYASTDAYFEFDPTAGTTHDLEVVVSGLLAAVQNCSGGRIVEAQIRIGLDVSTFAAKPLEPAATISNNLALKFTNTSDSHPWDFLVPAVSQTVIVSGGPDMTEDATIDVLADLLENGATVLPGFGYVTNRGGLLGPTAGGFLSIRKRGKRIQRKSARIGV